MRAMRIPVVRKTQITAMAQPTDTLPCSNSRMMKVETVRVLGGATMDAATSSRKEMMKIIMNQMCIRDRARRGWDRLPADG